MEGDYYKKSDSVEEYIKLAEGYNGEELILRLKKFLSKDSSLLEIGSGPGSDLKILNKHYKVVGSDNSGEFLSRLISNNPTIDFFELDAITLNTEKTFDGVYSNKVLQHLKDEELISSIRRQSEILNTDGVICHSFWKGEGSEIFKGLFVNYHSEITIRNFFEKYFEILVIESYKEFENNDSILIIGKKK